MNKQTLLKSNLLQGKEIHRFQKLMSMNYFTSLSNKRRGKYKSPQR